jgi:hypothetical protein
MPIFNSYVLNNTLFCDQTDITCYFTNTDLSHRTICARIKLVDCTPGPDNPCGIALVNNGLIICDPEASWNCNLCPNDLPYYNVVKNTDILYFQFQQVDPLNGTSPTGSFTYGWGSVGNPSAFVGAVIRDCCTGNPLENSFGTDLQIGDVQYSTGFVGVYPQVDYNNMVTWSNLQQNQIDMALLAPYLQSNGTDCFFVEFVFNTGTATYSLYTEPYKLEHCENTILLEATGTGNYKDCFGYITNYDANNCVYDKNNNCITPVGWGTLIPYRSLYRLKGFLELTGINVKKEFVGTYQNTVSTDLSKVYTLTTNRIPERVATLVAYMIANTDFSINGLQYVVDGDIAKNNDIGSQWFLEVQLRSVKCTKSAGGCN